MFAKDNARRIWPASIHGPFRVLFTFSLIIAGLFLHPPVANAATYYLDATNGDDSNPGTSAEPWKTLNRAYTWYSGADSKVQDGDTVLFKNGNYGTFREHTNDGESRLFYRNDWITYKAAPGHSPSIERIEIQNADKWGPEEERENGRSYLIFDGFRVLEGVDLKYTSYVQVFNSNITGPVESVEGLYAPYSAAGVEGVDIQYANHITIEDNDVSYAYRGIGIIQSSSDITIKNNTIHRISEVGLVSTGDNVLIEGNLIYNINQYRTSVNIFGVKTGDFIVGETVIMEGTDAKGIVFRTYLREDVLEVFQTTDVEFYDGAYTNPRATTMIGQSSGATLSNITKADPAHSDAISLMGGNNITVTRNKLIRAYKGGADGQGLKLDRPKNLSVINNLIVAHKPMLIEGVNDFTLNNNTFVTDYFSMFYAGGTQPTIINNMYNNILGSISVSGDGNGQYQRVINHGNNIFGNNPDGAGGPAYPFSVNSTELVNYNLDSLFVDAANNDFNLAPDSIAIDFGNPNYGPSSDILGVSRNIPPDAGCYEYVSSPSSNQSPVLQEIGSKSVNENASLTFTVSATDGDQDTITYSATGLPSDATFSGQTFSWTPGYPQAGTHDVIIIASDGEAQDSETVTITVNNINRAPVLTAIGSKSASENALLTITASATDADGETLTYSAQDLPSGATFSGQSFSWTPGYTQAGTYDVTFVASDGEDQDSETVTVTVSNTNRAPVLAAVGNQSVNEASLLSFPVSAADADGDTISYSAGSLPSGAAFAGQTFIWTPGYEQAASFEMTFTASDSQAEDSETVTITVNNVNRAPILEATADKSVADNTLLTFGIEATDPDGDTIEYSATGLPAGAAFADQTFNWTPTAAQADSSYQVTLVASDGDLEDSQAMTIVVSDDSAPAVANSSPAADSIQAPLNSLIVLHVVDEGKGVDADSVTIKLDDDIIYTGNTSDCTSAGGNCRRAGTKANYTYAYQSSQIFGFDQTKTVTVNATDLAGNVMTETYSFRTEMRSFGQNKQVDSGVEELDKGAPATVRDSSGDTWAAWHAGPTGSRDVYVARLTAGTDTFGAGVQLTDNAADQCNPAVALGADDKLYVVWQDNRRGNWDIYASTSTNGTSWSAEQRVTDSNDNQINPALAIDGQSPNCAHVVFQDDRAGNQDIYVAASSNAFLTKTLTRITSDTSDQLDPAIAVDSSNTAYVLWTDARNSSNDIYGATGSSWTNVPIVNKAADQSSPAIAVESTGSILHLLWVDQTSGDKDIYYASSDGLPSSPLSGSNLIDDTSGADQLSPAIAVTGSAGSSLKVFATWLDMRNVAGSTGDTDLYLTQTNSGYGTNVLVGDGSSSADQSEPAMGTDQYGHPYLVWTDGRNTNTEIYYAASTFMQPDVLTSKQITNSSGATVGTDPATITGADDVSVVVPVGACPYDVTIAITKIENPQEFAVPQLSSYDFGPSGIDFGEPVTITIPYAVADSATSPSAYWYDSLTGALSQQGITDVETIVLSSTLHALRFKTTHFTPFYLLAGGAAAAIGGGGGGGGGGCSVSSTGRGNIVEFLVPYLGLAVVMAMLKRRDTRNRSARNIAKGNR